MHKYAEKDRQLSSNYTVLGDKKSSIILMAYKTNIILKEKFRKGNERTDLIPSSISPALLWGECRKLRRNVNFRRKRVDGSIGGVDKSIDCCWFVGDCGLDESVDGVVSLNRSKNVLFLFEGVRLAVGVCIGDAGAGVGTLDATDDGGAGGGAGVIAFGFDFAFSFGVFCIVRIGPALLDKGVVFVDDDDDEGDVVDEAKYTVSVVMKRR